MADIHWTRKAWKQLLKLPKTDGDKIYGVVGGLSDWPQVRQVKALVGMNAYRLRVGNYRVIFGVDESGATVIITIEYVGKRDEHTYKQ